MASVTSMKHLILFCLAFGALSLGGCSTAKGEPALYRLSSAPVGQINSSQRIGILSVEVPAYARQEKIATLTGSHKISLDDDNRWAEPVEENITNVLARDLSRQTGAFVARRPYPRGLDLNQQVKLIFDTFVRGADGSAIMNGQYFILQGRAETVSDVENFSITIPSRGNDYDGYITAASEGITELARDIAQSLNMVRQF